MAVHKSVYPVSVCVAIRPVEAAPVSTGAPKTGDAEPFCGKLIMDRPGIRPAKG